MLRVCGLYCESTHIEYQTNQGLWASVEKKDSDFGARPILGIKSQDILAFAAST